MQRTCGEVQHLALLQLHLPPALPIAREAREACCKGGRRQLWVHPAEAGGVPVYPPRALAAPLPLRPAPLCNAAACAISRLPSAALHCIGPQCVMHITPV